MTTYRIFLRGAWLTIATLFGGIATGLFLGTVLFHILPGSDVNNPTAMHTAIAAFPALLGFLAGGAAWGMAMDRFAGSATGRRAAAAGMLGFGPITLVLAVGLSILEPAIVEQYGATLPLHRLFTLLFVPSAALIAGTSTWAMRVGIGGIWAQKGLALRIGLSAGLTFLVVNLIMEASGWVVGAPGAADRATMLVVLFTGLIATAFTAGGLIGVILRGGAASVPPSARIHHAPEVD